MALPTLLVPDDPADRRRVTRRASRLIVLDRDDRVLLFRDSDLGLDPVPHWWITPGGGVDPGESDLDAAVRELREETGLVAEAVDFIGPVATRHVLHGYSDVVTAQDEVFFALNVDRFALDTSEHTAEEQACLVDHGWFSRDEVAAFEEPVWPLDLVTIWGHAVAMVDDGALAALDLPDVEESTVPAGGCGQPA